MGRVVGGDEALLGEGGKGVAGDLEGAFEGQQPENQPTTPNDMPPIAPQRRPFRPLSKTKLGSCWDSPTTGSPTTRRSAHYKTHEITTWSFSRIC
jgi:hypothetical protein